MLRTYLKANKQNHTYLRYTGEGATGSVGSNFNILTEDGINLVTEGSDSIVQEGA
jgi:hypothetical protein